MTRAEFVSIARSWMGTTWKHQGRKKGIGVDCIGFASEVGREAGLIDVTEAANYQRRPDSKMLRAKMGEYLQPIKASELRPGDLVLLAFDGVETHVAIVGDYPAPGELSLIHAYLVARKVVEHRLDPTWRNRIAGCYRVPAFSEATA